MMLCKILAVAIMLVHTLIAAEVSLVRESQYWPMHIEVTETIEAGKMGNQQTLIPGDRGLLLRNEGDLLLVDFSRKGHAAIDPASTDFFTNATAIREGKQPKNGPIMLSYLSPRLFDPTHPGYRVVSTNDLLRYKQFLFIYADLSDPENIEAIKTLGELHGKLEEPTWTAFIFHHGLDRAQFKELLSSGVIKFPAAYYHMSMPFETMIKHEAPRPFGVIVTDGEGAILRPMAADRDPESLGELVRSLSTGGAS